MKRFLSIVAFLSLCSFSIGQVLINEVDYDDIDADTLEFIEFLNTTGSPIDLSDGGAGNDGYYLMLVNPGTTGGPGKAIYQTIELLGTIPANGFYTLAMNGNDRVADQGGSGKTDGFVFNSAGVIQNGAPDGVALIRRVGAVDTLLDSISYEHASAANDYESVATANGLLISFEFAVNGINATDTNTSDDESVSRILGANNPNDKTQWHPAVVPVSFSAPNPAGGNFAPTIVEFAPFPTLPTSTDNISVFALVTDPENNPLTVTADMTLQGGGTNSAALLDNGVAPDAVAGDNIYSGTITAFGGADDGKTLSFVIHANDGTNPTVDSAARIVTIDDTVSPVTIAAARAAAVGDFVIVNGITNTGKGVFNANTFYLQDATGGLNNFDTNFDVVPNALIPLAADITVKGRRSYAFGDSQTLNDVQLNLLGNANGYDWLGVRVNSIGNPLHPVQDVTTAQLEANILDLEGELVRVSNVNVSSGSWPNPGNSGQFEINDGSGDVTCFIDVDAALTQRTDPAFGAITGIAMSQQVTGPARDPRLLPRFDSDIETASASPIEFWVLYE